MFVFEVITKFPIESPKNLRMTGSQIHGEENKGIYKLVLRRRLLYLD